MTQRNKTKPKRMTLKESRDLMKKNAEEFSKQDSDWETSVEKGVATGAEKIKPS